MRYFIVKIDVVDDEKDQIEQIVKIVSDFFISEKFQLK